MTNTDQQDTKVERRVYVCNHEAGDINECEHCPEIIRLIQSNNRLMNIRHIFIKVLTEIGPLDLPPMPTLTEEEARVFSYLIAESNQ